MHNEIVFAVHGLVCVGQAHLNAAKMRAAITPQTLIMISTYNSLCALYARFLDNVIV